MSDTEFDDLALLTPDLASLGWTADLDDWSAELAQGNPELTFGRLARVSRGFSLVFTGGDAILAASSSERSTLLEAPATGDFVAVADDEADGPSIFAIAPRASALQRRAAGRIPEPQTLAANVDAVFVMHGLDRPMNVRRLERLLVVAWDSGAQPIVVLTKADTVDDETRDQAVAMAEGAAPGVAVVPVSVTSGQNVERITAFFDGNRTVALMGLSGIGKSTLVNELSDGRVQRTGEVRAADRRGRHTTVTRDLIPLPMGGLVIDAPGVREIGLWQAYVGLDKTFPEIAEAATNCRFTDCNHEAEPGCAVRERIADGAIAAGRLAHWRELHAELDLQESQLEEFARRSESRDRAEVENARDGARPSRKSRKQSGRKSGSRKRKR
ncbi:MAG: ribosome small subunit-dependent GTPase A [Acidimicrobiales bacterium]